MEKKGIFEAQLFINGTKLYMQGAIQSGLESIEDVVIKIDCLDVMTNQKGSIVVGSSIVLQVVKKLEKEIKKKRKERKVEMEVEEENVELMLEASITLRRVFLECLEFLTLFKNKEKNIFILAYKPSKGKARVHVD